MIKQWLF